jgi:hypothetical protein
MSSQLLDADKQFFLGLYRCAVSEYKPKIEQRTGVEIGDIEIKDFGELDRDRMQELEQARQPFLRRLLRRSAIKAWLKEYREAFAATHSERANSCVACYRNNCIYVSFAPGVEYHEFGIVFTTIHELTHALWERIEGKPLHSRRDVSNTEQDKFCLLVEGYSTYAENSWFLDMYPQSVKRDRWRARPTPGSLHERGMLRVTELVKHHGSQILLEIPRRWREF